MAFFLHAAPIMTSLLLQFASLRVEAHQIRQSLYDDPDLHGPFAPLGAEAFDSLRWADVGAQPSPSSLQEAPGRYDVTAVFDHDQAERSQPTLSLATAPRTQVVQFSGAESCFPNCDDTAPVTPVFDTAAASSCSPQCFWKCSNPKCDQVCKPVCKAPRCETRCPRVPDLSGCSVECDEPICHVEIPERSCPLKQGCPGAETKCSEPHCRLACSGEQTGCKHTCETPECDWDCQAPSDCPEPQCQMVCEQPKPCMKSMTHHTMPALRPGEMSVKSFAVDERVQHGSQLMQVNATVRQDDTLEGPRLSRQTFELPMKRPARAH